MKNLISTVLLAAVLFAAVPATQAADWSDDHFSCDVDVLKVGAGEWFEYYYWGVWSKLNVKIHFTSFYQGVKYPEAVYYCILTSASYIYSCSASRNIFTILANANDYIEVKLTPGVSKKDVCDIVYKRSYIKWPK